MVVTRLDHTESEWAAIVALAEAGGIRTVVTALVAAAELGDPGLWEQAKANVEATLPPEPPERESSKALDEETPQNVLRLALSHKPRTRGGWRERKRK